MSARFWLFSMTSAGAALVSGLGLGFYATTPPRMAFGELEATRPIAQGTDAAPSLADLNGPVEIRCTGCGPTLAQRQMAMMMGGWDGYSDPVVQDYAAQDYGAPDEPMLPEADAQPSPIHQLPANVDRFAAGEPATPEPVQLAQGRPGATADYLPAAATSPY